MRGRQVADAGLHFPTFVGVGSEGEDGYDWGHNDAYKDPCARATYWADGFYGYCN